MGPETLAQVLRLLKSHFNPEQYPNLLVGLAASDDAAVYKISEECALIQTIDFFPPIVNDPYDFSAIAAANSLSDVYAMGGEVTLVLNVCCFPEDLPAETMENILFKNGNRQRAGDLRISCQYEKTEPPGRPHLSGSRCAGLYGC